MVERNSASRYVFLYNMTSLYYIILYYLILCAIFLFDLQVKDFAECMTTLSATPFLDLSFGDDQTDLDEKFQKWRMTVVSKLAGSKYGTYFKKKANNKKVKIFKRVAKGAPVASGVPVVDVVDEPEEDDEEEEDKINYKFVVNSSDEEGGDDAFDKSMDPGADSHSEVVDVEDMGAAIKQSLDDAKSPVEREMVTKMQRKALTKEGYKVIGTHSAVKLCRWTKNQLRGRGGCYKHTFYGITSYQCMEMTPSLACANKCVFCWRHHKNPVGTEWRWKTDGPEQIVDTAIVEHQKMVYMMKGVPGVQQDRLKDANTVRHCALSLVGEPIMYPRINEMLKRLHDKSISTFMVTNGQFPECIEALEPVTQLYVSIDAATKDSLKAVDRPLFKDFWERYMESLDLLAKKTERTVYRMTLVKSYNMTEVEGYCELIERGLPDFIEIKAVTYCGKSDASSLTMQNVPWHEEVCDYAEAISNRLSERGLSAVQYSVATEHQHSCCILLAREDKYKPNGVWHTWIDYPKYDELVQRYYASGETFTGTEYMLPTPDWAIYKSKERGFDPVEQRWRRNQLTGAVVEIEYKPSSSGCG
jgi:tRNA wybutosine-synthesizing protein 1